MVAFDPFTIDERTAPTRDDAVGLLETGNLPVVRNGHSPAALVLQWEALLAVAVEALPRFAQAGLELGARELVLGQRLAAMLVPPTADRGALHARLARRRELAAGAIQVIQDGRDDVVRLARDRRVPEQLFRVNLGEGDAVNVLPGAQALLQLVDRHGARLAAPELVAQIRDEVRDAVEELQRLVSEEPRPAEPDLPVEPARVRGALYGLLLKLSRLGPPATRGAPALRRRFRLELLKPHGGGPGGQDDDESPVAETSPGGFGTPAEPVAAAAVREA